MELNNNKETSSNKFPIVGIGASVASLEAIKKLIKAIPQNPGLAFVLIHDLDPYELLPQLLQNDCNLPIAKITGDAKTQVHPNNIYVIYGDKILLSEDGILFLSQNVKRNKKSLRLPIDRFFKSLAEVHQELSMGIVLSGNTCDGTTGLKAIKENGGITFAQDEKSAEYAEMPLNAVKEGVVDFVLSPEQIPNNLLEISKIINHNLDKPQNHTQQSDETLNQIIGLLRDGNGLHFQYFNQNTIRKRIRRRMVITKNVSLCDYFNFISINKNEQVALVQELLLGINTFSRANKSPDSLFHSIFSIITKNKDNNEAIRIWVPACGTGQEVYFIAVWVKYLWSASKQKVQIFATDLSESNIGKARTGTYHRKEIEGATYKHLQDFFTKVNGHYEVSKAAREICVFAVHDYLNDPPFGKMDLIIGPNVLCYLERQFQTKALTSFHSSLNKKGLLIIDQAVNIGASELFAPHVNDGRLFFRNDVAADRSPDILLNTWQHSQHQKTTTNNDGDDIQKLINEILLSKYAPVGVVVNDVMEVVHFCGNTNLYLEQKPGKPSYNLINMARTGLGLEISEIFEKVRKEKKPFVKENIKLSGADQPVIAIESVPLPNAVEPHYLVLFHKHKNNQLGNVDKDLRIQQLEQELGQMHEDFLQLSKELQSVREHFLNAEEELRLLKEEIRSITIELSAVNQELAGLYEHERKVEEALKQTTVNLLQKNEEIIKIYKELESLAYVSSHDLQEPLRKIQTFTTRIVEIESAVISEKTKKYIQRIRNSAIRMQTLIQALVFYFSIHNNDQIFEKVDLNIIVDEVKNDLKDTILRKNATIETHNLREESIIRFQFNHMLNHVISNALKFSNPEQAPHIVISCEIVKGENIEHLSLISDKTYCHLTINDNGIGFESQYKDKIFEIFQRLSRREEYPGTGMGLAIVKKIVENHKGIITASGELKKGSTFNIYFPAIKD